MACNSAEKSHKEDDAEYTLYQEVNQVPDSGLQKEDGMDACTCRHFKLRPESWGKSHPDLARLGKLATVGPKDAPSELELGGPRGGRLPTVWSETLPSLMSLIRSIHRRTLKISRTPRGQPDCGSARPQSSQLRLGASIGYHTFSDAEHLPQRSMRGTSCSFFPFGI